MLGSIFSDYWPSVAAFTAFGLFHSVCAQEPFKQALSRLAGEYFVRYFWRILYCGLSYGTLYYGVSALHWGRNAGYDIWMIPYPNWLWQIIVVVHLGSVVLLYVAFLQSNYLEFLGLKQAYQGMRLLLDRRRKYADLDLFGTDRLVVTGLYGWVRHPMLAGGLLFLLTSGPSLNNLVFTAMYTVYMLIGGHYEERRMVRIFGRDYRLYQRQVGGYFPRLIRRGHVNEPDRTPL